MKRKTAHRMAFSALLAASYAALTAATSFMSFGSMQLRIAEALCVLPFFFPWTTWGLALGCLLSNLLSPLGALDTVFGTLATLLSCLCIAVIGKEGREHGWGACIAACGMPVLWNGLIIGCVLALTGEYTLLLFPVTALMFGGMVAVGEAVVLFVLGLPLLRWLPGSRVMKLLREKLDIPE